MRLRGAALSFALLLAACGQEGEQPAAGSADGPGEAVPPPLVPPPPSGASAASGTQEPAAMALMAEGLSLLPVGVFQPQVIAFGAPRAAVEQAVRSAFPDVPAERGRNEECGAGPIEFTRWGTLTLNFRDGRFIGWFQRAPSDIATIDGIRPGVTRGELESERPVDLQEGSTLEGEFSYTLPNKTVIHGFFEGQGSLATVNTLWSGDNCFFR